MTESTDHISKALGEVFPKSAIKTRPGGGGKQLSYVEGHTVLHRLNTATGNNWDLAIRSIDTMQLGPKTLMRAHVALTIPGLGTREHIGVQAVDERGGEDLVKGVVTDALKKAATLFGVGLELFGPDYEAGELPAAPPRQRNVSQNTVPNAPEPPRNAETPAPASEHATMDQKALTAIFALTKKRNITNDDLHAIVRMRYGVESLKALRVDHGRDLYQLLQKESDEGLQHELYLATREPGADDEPGELTLADSFGGAPYVDLAAQYRER